MNLPNELACLIREKHVIQTCTGRLFHQLPKEIVAIATNNLFLLEKYAFSSDTVRWLIREENVAVMTWIYRNRNLWHNLPNDVIILAIVTNKPKMLEWADSVLDSRLKADILYAFKAVTNKNDYAVELLRARGYRWSDDLLNLEENIV